MDARITTFIYCMGTTNMEGKNAPINAMGVLSILTPEYIPSMFSFSIIMGIRGIDDTCNHSLDIIFKDPLKHPLVEAKNVLISSEQLRTGDLTLPDEFKGLVLGMDLRNVILKQEGVYWTEVKLDGKLMGDFDIYVKAKQRTD